MKVCRYYTFTLRFKGSAVLPRWKGYLLRGAIGYHLRRSSCTKGRECKSCSRLFSCPFGYIYESRSKGIVLRKIEEFPKPYSLKPPLDGKEVYSEGDRLTFSFVLLGDAVKFEDEIIRAVVSMCSAGIGVRGKRGRVELERIVVENPFNDRAEILYEDGAFYDSNLSVRTSHLDIALPKLFTVSFLTPFRLIRNDALISIPEFSDLLRFLLRKYTLIHQQYLLSPPDVNVDELLEKAERVRLYRDDLRKRKFHYKGRDEIFLHGSLTYSGRTDRKMRRVLAFGTLTNVGKRATHGHGWYVLSW